MSDWLAHAALRREKSGLPAIVRKSACKFFAAYVESIFEGLDGFSRFDCFLYGGVRGAHEGSNELVLGRRPRDLKRHRRKNPVRTDSSDERACVTHTCTHGLQNAHLLGISLHNLANRR